MLHGDVLGERARLSPDKLALVVVATGDRLTYRQLDERAVRCSRLLQERFGLRHGDRVAVLIGNRIEYFDFFFAAAKTGIILVPLSTRATASELSFIVADCDAALLVYDGDHAGVVHELRTMVHVPACMAVDVPDAATDEGYAGLLGRLQALPWTRTECDPEDTYALLYTSGTTGKPKGVMIPHRMIAWNACNTVLSWQLRDDDVSPIFTPMYHAGGMTVFLTALLAIGGTVVLHSAFDAAEAWHTIEAEKCTVIFGVPTTWKMMLEAPEFRTVDLSHVRWCISGGAPLPVYLIDAYKKRGVVLKQGYGLTEVGVNCFAMSAEESETMKGSIGRPMLFTQARCVGDDGLDVPTGEVGELLLKGPHVCTGYWKNPAATAASRDRDGWFHTGDLARRDAAGFFTIAGRKKDMIISGGVNVYPAELEGELLLHPAVQDAAVVGIPDETWGEVGVAFIVLLPGKSASPEELAGFLAKKLAKYKLPKHWRFVQALPRTPYGKVVKGTLRDQFLAEPRS